MATGAAHSATAITGALYPDSYNKSAFEQGMEFQDFCVRAFNKWGFYIQLNASKKMQFEEGESIQRCEIKLDNRCTDTGRLSIEIAEKTRNDDSRPWTPSGIYRNDNTVFYIQGNYELLLLFDKRFLQRWHQHVNPKEHESHGTVKKFYMPLDKALKYAIIVIDNRW